MFVKDNISLQVLGIQYVIVFFWFHFYRLFYG